jgi:hypothetical protein
MPHNHWYNAVKPSRIGIAICALLLQSVSSMSPRSAQGETLGRKDLLAINYTGNRPTGNKYENNRKQWTDKATGNRPSGNHAWRAKPTGNKPAGNVYSGNKHGWGNHHRSRPWRDHPH